MRPERWKDILPPADAERAIVEERMRRVLRAFEAGATGPEIARVLKISVARVYQIRRKAERLRGRSSINRVFDWKAALLLFVADQEKKAMRAQYRARQQERERLLKACYAAFRTSDLLMRRQ